jgi:Methyltransferase domain
MDRFRQYVVSGNSRIAGWFSRIDAEIFHLVTKSQNAEGWEGAVAEIGLHHGKSFVALCLALKDNERAYGIDLFEQQDRNLDQSGKGNRSILESNLALWSVPPASFTLDARSSELVTPEDILGSVGGVRFFSVDGGHWRDIVYNDLLLAERTLLKYGVIAVDDFLRAEWPDVSRAYFDWHRQRSKPLVPFAIGFNKLYLCDEELVGFYGKVLETSSFLRIFFVKRCEFFGRDVPVYQTLPLPEWGIRKRLRWYFKVFQPDTYARLKRLPGRSI